MKTPVVLFLYQELDFDIEELKNNLDFILEVNKYPDNLQSLIQLISKYKPHVIITFGEDWSEFNKINQLT